MIHVDTHVILWLMAGEIGKFGRGARRTLQTASLRASPMVAVELQYLFERGRIADPAHDLLSELSERVDFRLAESPFPRVAHKAWALDWTRDPFDRLIAAHALADDVPLLTADRSILDNCAVAVWD